MTTNIASETLTGILIGVALSGASYLIALFFQVLTPADLSWLEISGVALNYTCVWLAARRNIFTWPAGLLAVIVLGMLFYQLQLYSSLILHIGYFLPMQLVGWYYWLYGGEGRYEAPVASTNFSDAWQLAVVVAVVYPIAYYSTNALGAVMTGWDSAILVISVAAQYLLSKKKIESWILWMIVNVIAVYVYASTGAYLLAGQYVLFFFNALYGYWLWRAHKNTPISTILRVEL